MASERPKTYMRENKLVNDPRDYGLADDPLNIETYRRKLRMVVVSHEFENLEFDMIGVHPGIANAFRRIMIGELPSMAFEEVYIRSNTSIMHDEFLAHRIGLLPLKADFRQFKYRKEGDKKGTEFDTLKFELSVKYTKPIHPNAIHRNLKVFSGQIKWVPIGSQKQWLNESEIKCVDDDILLATLRPGQELDLMLVAVLGIGNDHAKFSPVSTATYRLMPEIKLLQEVKGNDAVLLQKCFSPNVIGIDENDRAYVINARYDTCSRNVFRYPELAKFVEMSKIRDHYIFNVETCGALDPAIIFLEAAKTLRRKCRKYLNGI